MTDRGLLELAAIDCLDAMNAQKKEYERKINKLKEALERISNSGDLSTASGLQSIADNALYDVFNA